MHQPRRRAFTLIELLVVIAIIALLIAILLPALGAARQTAKTVQCSSQLRQQGIGLGTYVTDSDGYFPAGHFQIPNDSAGRFYYVWPSLVRDGMSGEAGTEMFNCPSALEDFYWEPTYNPNIFWVVESDHTQIYRFKYFQDEVPVRQATYFTYGYNEFGVQHFFDIEYRTRALGLGAHADHPYLGGLPEAELVQPSGMIAVTDVSPDKIGDMSVSPRLPAEGATWDKVPSRRHADGSVVLYTDGHANRQGFDQLTARNDQARRQWNRDFEAHEEWWEPEGGGE